eukprot:gene14817-609_t
MRTASLLLLIVLITTSYAQKESKQQNLENISENDSSTKARWTYGTGNYYFLRKCSRIKLAANRCEQLLFTNAPPRLGRTGDELIKLKPGSERRKCHDDITIISASFMKVHESPERSPPSTLSMTLGKSEISTELLGENRSQDDLSALSSAPSEQTNFQ